MSEDEIEITVGGGPGRPVAEAADQVALALMSAGATVDFPSRPTEAAATDGTLRGARVVVRTAGRARRTTSAAPGGKGLDLAAVAKLAVGVVLMLALFDAEMRLRFGLRLDTVITAAALWWFWRWCQREVAIAARART
jgi:hypothetical protein